MAELKQGQKIRDRYELREYKGSGSFGEVWKAYDELVGAEVAIKVYISLDQRGVEEFRNEYRATVGVQHENLLTPKHFDIWEHRPFLIMKYCEKGSSTTLIEKADEKTLWQFIHDVAAGLAYLHSLEEPMIHQDIKPDNILIGSHGRFLITDFGISRRLRSTMRKQSKRAANAGATSYMGPERFEEDPMPVKASDIWSLGASIYEIATGELPFSGLGGVMQKNGGSRPRLGAQWSNDLNMVMRSCLHINTWDRPKAAEIEAFAAAKLRGENPKPTWKTENPNPQPKPEPIPPTPVPSSNKRRIALWIALGVVGVIIGSVAALLLTRNHPNKDIPKPIDTTIVTPPNQDSAKEVNEPEPPAKTPKVDHNKKEDKPTPVITPEEPVVKPERKPVPEPQPTDEEMMVLAAQGDPAAQTYMARRAQEEFNARNYQTAYNYAKAANQKGKPVLEKLRDIHFIQ